MPDCWNYWNWQWYHELFENIGAIGLTRVGARRVVQAGGVIMIILGNGIRLVLCLQRYQLQSLVVCIVRCLE